MASTTVHRFASDGSTIKRGVSVVANNGTINTGLSQIDGFVAKSASNDTVISLASKSAGTATVRIFTAGSANASETTLYWEAWDYRRI